MSRFQTFPCGECGSQVVLATGPGRTAEYRVGVPLPVPADLAIPTCRKCGETYFTVELSARLAKAQAPLYDRWVKDHLTRLVGLLRDRHGLTLRQIETACGVTATYFSHVMKGRKKTSLPLIRLVEAFVAAPHELLRHVSGKPLQTDELTAETVVAYRAPVIEGFVRYAIGGVYREPTIVRGTAANDAYAA